MVVIDEPSQPADCADRSGEFDRRVPRGELSAILYAATPRTGLGVFARNQVTRALSVPLVSKLAFGSSLLDRIDLPDYG
jgi:hypothetical protein